MNTLSRVLDILGDAALAGPRTRDIARGASASMDRHRDEMRQQAKAEQTTKLLETEGMLPRQLTPAQRLYLQQNPEMAQRVMGQSISAQLAPRPGLTPYQQRQLALQERAQAFREQQANRPAARPTSERERLLGMLFSPDTPPEQREVIRGMLVRSGTTVNVNNGDDAQGKRYERGNAVIGELDGEVIRTGRAAADLLPSLAGAETAVLSDDFYQGVGGNFTDYIKRGLSVVPGVDIEGLGEATVVRDFANQMGLAKLAQMKGTPSNRDLDFVLETVPNIGNPRVVNSVLLTMARAKLEAERDIGQAYERQYATGGQETADQAIEAARARYRQQITELAERLRSEQAPRQAGPAAGIKFRWNAQTGQMEQVTQ